MEVQNLIEQVKHAAERELEYCNTTDTPVVCDLIVTETGKNQVIDLIVEYVGSRGISISEAIVEIEREKNVKLSEN